MTDDEVIAVCERLGSQRAAARELGVARKRIWRAYTRAGKKPSSAPGAPAQPPGAGLSAEYRDDCATVESRGRICTLEALLEAADVDQAVWEVDRHVVNKWEMGAKGADGKVAVEPLWQVKVWLRRRVDALAAARFRDEVLEQIARHAPAYPPVARESRSDEPILLAFSPADLHLGKLAWGDETGAGHYDSKIAAAALLEAVEEILERVAGFNVARICYVAGNDFLHTDGTANLTTAGTPQDADMRHSKMFRLGWELQVAVIDRLMQRAPVDVVVVAGNHDRDSMFKLGEVLQAWYRQCDDVSIDNAPTLRKYYRWGDVLLGLTHGSEEREADLPLIMAQERPAEWAVTTHREWLIGHWHKKRETRYSAGDTIGGVIVRVLSSLSGIDAWHASKGYVAAQRAAEALLYGRDSAYVGHFSANARRERAA